jgi:methionine biosynthesis protein MetW
MTHNIGQNIVKHQIRYDLEIIAQLIKPKSKVLDIGCGDGELMEFLQKSKNVDARGLEISQEQVSQVLMRGLSAIHGNAENDLSFYPDRSFDYAILSQTIQATQKPKEILEEMLRVAEYAIVSLPNFAHYKNRLHLLFKGSMPVNKNIPFEWFETPNIHFCSIKDFEQFKEALALVWPIPNRSGVPTSLILCGRGGKFDAFVPSGKTSADRALASLFLKNKEQTAIIIDLQSSTLNILATDTTNDAATGTDCHDDRAEFFPGAQHEVTKASYQRVGAAADPPRRAIEFVEFDERSKPAAEPEHRCMTGDGPAR